MPTPFCAIADVTTLGIPASALGTLTTAQQQGACDAANGIVEAHTTAHFPLPYTSWGAEVTYWAVCIAQKIMLDVRGRNPSTASADKLIDDRFTWAEGQLDKVQRGALNPTISPATTGTSNAQPSINSFSSLATYDPSGATGPNRGI